MQKTVAEFTAGGGPDALYVYDDSLAGWAAAEYLQPLDGMPGVDEVYPNVRYRLDIGSQFLSRDRAVMEKLGLFSVDLKS